MDVGIDGFLGEETQQVAFEAGHGLGLEDDCEEFGGRGDEQPCPAFARGAPIGWDAPAADGVEQSSTQEHHENAGVEEDLDDVALATGDRLELEKALAESVVRVALV